MKKYHIKSKELNDRQLTTIYLYQSEFYYKYWNEQTRQIELHKKSTYLENYEYFIEIRSVDNHKIIIFKSEPNVVFYRGMNIPRENTDIFHQR
tara:strand:+ start:4795 stop:5073 length:279 start_codon:yes stop_codon:yes gene_type:complete